MADPSAVAPPHPGRALPPAERLTFLRLAPAFAALPEASLAELAARLREERLATGDVVVAQGEVADRLYVVAAGWAEVSTAGADGPVPVARLGPGELCGEIALLRPDARRTATVAALTPLWLLTLDRAPFDALLRRHPELRAALGAGAELMLRTDFLKAASPFATPPPGRLRDLAAGLEELAVPAGGDLVREGEPGEACYLLRRGRAVVLRRDGASGAERAVAELAAGAIVGEAALLDGAPRAATVRAVEDCALLALRRDALLAALGADPAPGAQLGGLARWRARPRRAPGVEAYRRATSTGETIATLKDRARGAYYRLAPRGWFLWERLDGERTMRALARDYLAAFRDAGPDAVAEVIAGLAGAGFVEGIALRADAGPLRRVRRLLG